MKKFATTFLSGILCLALFLPMGCKKYPYNAVMYGNATKNKAWLNDEFYEENLTGKSWSFVQEIYVSNDEDPETRTVKIADREAFNKTFKEFPEEVDFEKSMILMHGFTTASGSSYEIRDVFIEDRVLTIKYMYIPVKRSPPNASMPMTKWVIVVMDRVDTETVEFRYGK